MPSYSVKASVVRTPVHVEGWTVNGGWLELRRSDGSIILIPPSVREVFEVRPIEASSG